MPDFNPQIFSDYALYGRTYKLKIVTAFEGLAEVVVLTIENLDIRFNVTRTLTKEANTAKIRVFNLNEMNRANLSQTNSVAVTLEAGYAGVNRIIFAGDMREVNSFRDGSDWITEFKAGDGEKKIKKKGLSLSIKGPVTLATILLTASEKLGFPLSTGSRSLLTDPSLHLEFAGNKFEGGYAASGKATEVLDTLLESTGLEWSIQSEEMQILTRGKPISEEEIYLTPKSGLLGSPKLGSDDVLSCRSLLIPDISPGRTLNVESKFVKGRYRVQTAKYTGYTAGEAWFIDSEAEAL